MIRKTEPNIVPLCDILLVLLIIFMVITPMGQSGIDIQLPSGYGPGDVPVVLTINGPDHFSLNKNEHFSTLEALDSRLREIVRVMRKKQIFVDSNRSVTYRDLVRILDAVRGAEIEHIVMMTTH